LLTDAEPTVRSLTVVTPSRIELRNAILVPETTTLLPPPQQLMPPNNAEPAATFHGAVMESSILVKIVMMETKTMVMVAHLTVSANVEMEKSILENNVIREPLLTTKDWLMDADLDVSTTIVEMLSRTQMNNAILELPTLTQLEMLAVLTVELLIVEMELSITEKLAIPSTILSVPPTVP